MLKKGIQELSFNTDLNRSKTTEIADAVLLNKNLIQTGAFLALLNGKGSSVDEVVKFASVLVVLNLSINDAFVHSQYDGRLGPSDPSHRVAGWWWNDPGKRFQILSSQGVVCDSRSPNVIRVTPVPAYSNDHDVDFFLMTLRKYLNNEN